MVCSILIFRPFYSDITSKYYFYASGTHQGLLQLVTSYKKHDIIHEKQNQKDTEDQRACRRHIIKRTQRTNGRTCLPVLERTPIFGLNPLELAQYYAK